MGEGEVEVGVEEVGEGKEGGEFLSSPGRHPHRQVR